MQKKSGQWVYIDKDSKGRPRERVIDEKLWAEIKENFLRYGICNIYNRERKQKENTSSLYYYNTKLNSKSSILKYNKPCCSCCSKNKSKSSSHKPSSSNCSCRGGTDRK